MQFILRRFLICLLLLTGWVVETNGASLFRVGLAGEKLTWAPPSLVNPLEVTVNECHRSLKLDKTKDYVIRMPNPITTGGVSIWGGHNVVLIGGEINITDPKASPGRGLYIQAATGTFHLEGVLITGTSNYLGEGIDVAMREPGSMLQIENVRVATCYGARETNHADVIQTWAGPPTLRIDRLTGYSTYQGFFLLPNQHEPKEELKLFDFRHLNLVAGGYALWWQEKPPIPLHLEDVWVKPMFDPKRWPDLVLWPKGSSQSVWKGVQCGNPPEGDFVPEGVPGCDYRSPGYVGAFLAP